MGFKKGHPYFVTADGRRKISSALIGIKRSEETKRKMGLAKKGKKYTLGMKHTEDTKRKIGLANSIALKGRKLSDETRKKMSASRRGKYTGSQCSNWKGGVTPKNLVIRMTSRYKEWRESVFKRDNYTCILCGVRGHKLNADHIKPFAHYPELRFELSNGRTLCVPCHRKTDTYGPRANSKEFTKIYGV